MTSVVAGVPITANARKATLASKTLIKRAADLSVTA